MVSTPAIYCSRIYTPVRGVVSYFYRYEPGHFFEHIHKRGGGYEDCVADSIKSIEPESQLYGIYDGEKLVAFFSKYENKNGQSLNGFHVLSEYRNREFLTEFWQIVKSKFEKPIHTGIYVKNEPAIKCLLKAGFELHNSIIHDNKVFLILKFQ